MSAYLRRHGYRIIPVNPQLHGAMVEGERTNRVEVTLATDDVGKVIGRGGRNIDAIRAVVRAAALKNHDRVMVEIV